LSERLLGVRRPGAALLSITPDQGPKRRQAAALQGGAHFKGHEYSVIELGSGLQITQLPSSRMLRVEARDDGPQIIAN